MGYCGICSGWGGRVGLLCLISGGSSGWLDSDGGDWVVRVNVC